MKRKLLATILIVIALLGTSLISNAQNNEDIYTMNTLSMSQEEYIAQLNTISESENYDVEYLRNATETFLSLRRAYIRTRQDYNFNEILSSKFSTTKNILYRIKSDEYYSKMLEYDNRLIQWDDINFRDCKIVIDGEKASVEIVEEYTYYIDDKFKKTSYETTKYNIDFEIDHSKWCISSIVTSDPWESMLDFEYYDFDVDAEVLAKISALESDSDSASIETSTISPYIILGEPLYYYSYSRSDAVEYAEEWYDGVNSVFGEAGDDCQNFASQVLWAGLGADSTTGPPVVYDSTYGSSYIRLWQHNNYYIGHTTEATGYGWHWDNVDGFFWLVNTSTSQVEGPYGSVYFNLNYATEGDVIAVDWSSTSPSIGTLDHAMVVTDVTGSFGSRDTDDIFIAAHNNQTTSAYQSLDDYTGYMSESHFATAHITGGYYY